MSAYTKQKVVIATMPSSLQIANSNSKHEVIKIVPSSTQIKNGNKHEILNVTSLLQPEDNDTHCAPLLAKYYSCSSTNQVETLEGEGNVIKKKFYIDHNQDQDIKLIEEIKFCEISTAPTDFTAPIKYRPILSPKHPAKRKTIKTKKATQLLANENGQIGWVRRSIRKTESAIKEEKMQYLEQCVLEEREIGLKISYFIGKGSGIVADKHFDRNEFVIEYIGDLISITEATEREKRYTLDKNKGCYMYYFKYQNRQYCIDATADTGKMGRLLNHSRKGNLNARVILVRNSPHMILLANKNINPGEELTYDYGDRSKLSLQNHPWL